MILSPAMLAQGWRSYTGGDHDGVMLSWYHCPSQRAVTISDSPRDCTIGPAPWGEPASSDAEGFCVSCRVHDELGNPVSGEIVWIESLGMALRFAVALRESILADHPRPGVSEQGELFQD